MSRRSYRLCFCVVTALVALGCGDKITAPPGLDEPFSMYGILNPRLPTQTLLVSPIEDLLEPMGETIDAAVRSTDLESGDVRVWKDSVVVNETGQLDHVFWADFRPQFGSRHRIEVTRSDGASSFVEVDVPGRVTIDQIDTGTRFLRVTIEGEEVRLIRFDLTYVVRFYDAEVDTLGPAAAYTFARSGEALRRSAGWRVDVNLDSDYALAKSAYFADYFEDFDDNAEPSECAGLGLFELRVSLTIGSDDWDPPEGVFDPRLLVQPDLISNVENGFGFVGGGYKEERSLHPSEAALADTWFYDFLEDRRPEAGSCPGGPVGRMHR